MKHILLAFVERGVGHGYELKQAIEQAFGDAYPPINVGQIYTTLARLERDGLVCSSHVAQDGRPDKRVYALTDAGRAELDAWFEAPSDEPKLRDEFYSKLVLGALPPANGKQPQTAAAATTSVRERSVAVALIARQRARYLQQLRELNELALRQDPTRDVAALLLIEGAMLHLQADLTWLDTCEARLS
jgi:DNA-binding PadR family transcriptional regulator